MMIRLGKHLIRVEDISHTTASIAPAGNGPRPGTVPTLDVWFSSGRGLFLKGEDAERLRAFLEAEAVEVDTPE